VFIVLPLVLKNHVTPLLLSSDDFVAIMFCACLINAAYSAVIQYFCRDVTRRPLPLYGFASANVRFKWLISAPPFAIVLDFCHRLVVEWRAIAF
jgi:hypothetical protein